MIISTRNNKWNRDGRGKGAAPSRFPKSRVQIEREEKCPEHRFCAHPLKLRVIACIICGKEAAGRSSDTEDTKLSKYLSSRRKLRLLEGLCSLVVPIHPISVYTTKEIVQSVGVLSNTSCPHLTLVEGVPADRCFDLERTQSTMWKNPTMTIQAIQALPTVDGTKKLIIANIALESAELRMIVRGACTRLPQWPLHVALGAADSDAADDLTTTLDEKLRGRRLSLLPGQVAWLPPTPRKPTVGGTESCRVKSHGYRKHHESRRPTAPAKI
ncbi:expressed unknown protein [Seminavis robusta]|uniref:Uncharacterized protein n=1 Tax=Seminavis robusta TaxID=568900 RepID=A0A9N8E6N2_9STRA|nr:expressed unknown protein [Seminavis robusta]|eukprot:Sro601_g173470.1 n/a (270) ;mRNA; r:15145-15954